MVHPQALVHGKIVKGHGGVVVGMRADQIGCVAVGAKMHACGVNRQRQVAVQRLFSRDDPRITLARFNRDRNPRHSRRLGPPCARGVDQLAASHHFATGQSDTFNLGTFAGDRHDLIADIFRPTRPRLAAQPIEHGVAVKIAFVF